MPRLLLPAASATGHLSLSHFHCYCYSCPRLCHISALLLLHTLHWSPCCASGLHRARYPHCRAPHRRISRTGHPSAYMLDVIHTLPLPQRIMFRIGAMVWRCILGLAPAYLRDLCHPTPGTRGCSSLRSSEQGLLFVPFARTSTTQARAFSV